MATIHQPDFLPWFGFFNKVAKADVWIVLDHVENNPRDAAFWGRRTRILVQGRPLWLSVPLNRPAELGRVGIPIRDMTINRSDPRVFEKALRTVRQSYGKAPHFHEHYPLVASWFEDEEPLLAVRNLRFIRAVLERLGVRTRIVSSSTLGAQGRGTELLVSLLQAVQARRYLCGTGAGGYQVDAMFAAQGIALEYNRFVHPTYPQGAGADFVPGLSLIDALFHVPAERLSAWVQTA
jgi:hypothetical protein